GDGGQTMADGPMQACDCDGNCYGDNNIGNCDVYGRPRQAHSIFPGKLGYAWTAGFDAIGMLRTNGSERDLVLNTANQASVFNATQFAFPMTPGGRAFIQLMGPSGDTYQAVYFKLASFVADSTVTGNNNLQIPFPLASNPTIAVDYFGADQMQFHYTSNI